MNKLVSRYKLKYERFSKYLSNDFFEVLLEKFDREFNKECGISPDIYLGLYIKRHVDKFLVEKIKNDDIDLEIEFLDYQMPMLDLIVKKMNLDHLELDKEGIIILAISTYDGQQLFSLHLLSVIKSNLGRKIEKEIEVDNLEVDEDKDVPLDDDLDFIDRLKLYISNNKLSKLSLSYIEGLVVKFNLINIVDDERLKRYIYLRFGYCYGFSFSDEAICELLGISNFDANQMYVKSLVMMKEIMNSTVDTIVLSSVELGEKKKSTKKLNFIKFK